VVDFVRSAAGTATIINYLILQLVVCCLDQQD